MIMGLGSVGSYLLDYLMSCKDEGLEIYVVGRNQEKMISDVNIIRVAAMIRGQNRTEIKVISGVDFNDVSSIEEWKRIIVYSSFFKLPKYFCINARFVPCHSTSFK